MADSHLDDGNDTSTLEKIAAWLGMITLGSMALSWAVFILVFIIIPIILLILFVFVSVIGAAV